MLLMQTVQMISTHTPLARRDGIPLVMPIDQKISTHTPLARRDPARALIAQRLRHFYSHAPCGARHHGSNYSFRALWISTHTPHAGRDVVWAKGKVGNSNFYSHAPCGARPAVPAECSSAAGFLLTRPMRGATG